MRKLLLAFGLLALAGCEFKGVVGEVDAGGSDVVAQGDAKPDTGPTCTPRVEVCNGLDDDCDGLIDNGLNCQIPPGDGGVGCLMPTTDCSGACVDLRSDVNNCGACNVRCATGPNEIASCTNAVCTLACAPGYIDADHDLANGCEQRSSCTSTGMETCDGLDNDCNGQIDDGLGTVTCGIGACQRTLASCNNGRVVDCAPGLPSAEVCDGIDNDCNGATDEGLNCQTPPSDAGVGCLMPTTDCSGACVDLRSDVNNCGACNVRCATGPNEVASCTNAVCTLACAPGYVDADANLTNGCEQRSSCTPTGGEICDGLDNDCNGQIDEGLGFTSCGVGACQRTVANCVNGTVQACSPGAPSTEVCGDRIDNDCNGATDEGC